MFQPYGLLVGVAIVVAWSIAERVNSRVNKILPWVLVGGFVGARIYHVVDAWEYYSVNTDQIIAVWNGGLGIWGGIVGGIIGITIYSLIHKSEKNIWGTLGAIVVGLPLGQAIGRLGNAVNSEFGEKVVFLPWWATEAILDALLFGVLWPLRAKKDSRILVAIYLIGYGIIRFALEFYRLNNWVAGGLGVAQWASLTSIMIGLLIWLASVRD